MRIEIFLDTEDAKDLAGLAALIAVIGMPVADARPTRAPPPPPAEPLPSDALLEAAEAARLAGAGDEEDGEPGVAADPASLDPDGVPWDARIHASTKTKNGDGRWKKRKKVPEIEYGKVFAELQAARANLDTGTGGSGGVLNAGDTASTGGAGTGATSDAPLSRAAPPPPPSGGAAPTASGADGATIAGRFPDFGSFVQAVSAIRPGGIPYLELNGFAQTLGIGGGFKDMKDHADMWETFFGLAGGQ